MADEKKLARGDEGKSDLWLREKRINSKCTRNYAVVKGRILLGRFPALFLFVRIKRYEKNLNKGESKMRYKEDKILLEIVKKEWGDIHMIDALTSVECNLPIETIESIVKALKTDWSRAMCGTDEGPCEGDLQNKYKIAEVLEKGIEYKRSEQLKEIEDELEEFFPEEEVR